jgi:hypothetical protein
MEFPMSFSRKAVLALTGIAALAMPLAVAGSASAATDARCTVTPLTPVFDHVNSSGEKVIKYETKVTCSAGRSIEILDERRDHDALSTDDYEGSNTYDLRFDRTDTVTKYVLAVLPDADGWGDDNEEMYHAVGFQVTEDNGYVSSWTNWEDSPIATFHL